MLRLWWSTACVFLGISNSWHNKDALAQDLQRIQASGLWGVVSATGEDSLSTSDSSGDDNWHGSSRESGRRTGVGTVTQTISSGNTSPIRVGQGLVATEGEETLQVCKAGQMPSSPPKLLTKKINETVTIGGSEDQQLCPSQQQQEFLQKPDGSKVRSIIPNRRVVPVVSESALGESERVVLSSLSPEAQALHQQPKAMLSPKPDDGYTSREPNAKRMASAVSEPKLPPQRIGVMSTSRLSTAQVSQDKQKQAESVTPEENKKARGAVTPEENKKESGADVTKAALVSSGSVSTPRFPKLLSPKSSIGSEKYQREGNKRQKKVKRKRDSGLGGHSSGKKMSSHNLLALLVKQGEDAKMEARTLKEQAEKAKDDASKATVAAAKEVKGLAQVGQLPRTNIG